MGKLGFFDFIRDQFTAPPPVETVDLTGKTVIVTGANVGLGFEASKHFAKMNPSRLILACRNQQKGEAALLKLEEETGYKGAELWTLDLSDFSSVIAFADRFGKDGGRLDILVENAAIVMEDYTVTKDGWESTLQVNCLSPFLIALRLLPQMINTDALRSTRPRLVFVTSELHFWANIPKKVLESDNICKAISSKEYNASGTADRYQDSKLFDILFCQALDERLGPNSLLIVNTVNPGFCMSEIRRDFSGMRLFVAWLMEKILARTTEQGSRQLVYAAVGGTQVEDQLQGAYISSARVSEASDFAVGPEGHAVQNKLWEEVLDILSQVDVRVRQVAKQYLSRTIS